MKFTALSFAVMLLCAGLFIPLSGFAQETGASAQPDCALPPQFIDSRPDAVEQATQVSIGAALIDLRRINDPEQAVTVDLLITLGWLDPRLAMLAGCRVSANDIWNPRIEILNAGTVDARGEFAVTIAEDGKVHGQMRITGVFVTPLDIDDFPFDQQQLSLKAMSLRYTADELELVVDQAWTGQRDTLSIPDWHIGTVSASVREHFVPQLSRTYSRYEMEI
ncbi:MAG: hypothetical protein OEQ74_11545, partial [Gammaproteobacteria bacterium]|nr:hypothetical protein [Gammaproteobacteria bacterium]